ncbi:MAG: succinate dehydrogenase cytochrome b subunit [Desulfobacteraceae bacterium]|nr:succinate dehydrogenase cytochrome b subunit [Desulfobacteraceae bacterium]
MNWFTNIFGTSIGKKLMMAITGLCFCGFLVIHLTGNLTLYGGKDLFNAYVEQLHLLDPIIIVVQWILLFLAAVHVTTGITLFYQNLTSRPQRYHVNRNAGGRTIGSATMPYTGFIILFFIIIHLFDFHFADRSNQTLFDIVAQTLSRPGYAAFYIFATIVAAIHISHGFWSAFQTIGASHPKYMPIIKGLGIAFSIIVGICFGFIPIYVSII